MISVVDRDHFDADPNLTFHFDADPDPDPTPSFKQVGKNRTLFGILLTAVPVYEYCIILLVILKDVVILNIWTEY